MEDAQEKGRLKNATREATDVAETPPFVYERTNEHLGVSQASYFDITVHKPLFEKKKDYDAELQQYPPVLGYNNFPWGTAKIHMERMTLKFLEEGMSFIIVCNDVMDEREYFIQYIEAFAKAHHLPPMAFGGYKKKLDHGVCIMYLLQPEWINMI